MTEEEKISYMRRCLSLAKKGMGRVSPNPMVGCVIVKDGRIIGEGYHRKYGEAHAEVNAIRNAAKKLKTHDLSGCTLYVNAEPCPMCLSAIIWSNIKEVYFANTKKDADEIGFRDDMIYEYLKGNDEQLIEVRRIESEEALEVFKKFKKLSDKTMY